MLFVVLVFAVVLLVSVARPIPALAGFAIVLAGLPIFSILASRGSILRMPGGTS